MTTAQSPESFMGRTAVDPQGDKIGKIGQVYVDDATNPFVELRRLPAEGDAGDQGCPCCGRGGARGQATTGTVRWLRP